MKILLKLVIGILSLTGGRSWGQDVTGRFYPEKQHYLVGEPIFIVLELTNISSKILDLDDGHCSTTFEAQAAWRQLNQTAPAMGVGGSCGATIAPWPQGLTIRRRFQLEGPFRLDSPGVYPMRGHHTAYIRAFDEIHKPFKTGQIDSDFEVLVTSANVRERFRGQPSEYFEVIFPPGIQSNRIQVIYHLTGTFGGYGLSARPEPGKPEYTIPTEVDGEAADALKALVYVPGCQIAKISVSSLSSSTRKADFACKASSSIPFRGRIEHPEFLGGHNYEVGIYMIAHWAMGYFEIADGMVPTFQIASLAPSGRASFRGQIPDFTRDAVANSTGNGNSALQFVVREKGTGNILGFLQPTDDKYEQFGDVRLQRSYPDEVSFRLRQ